MQLKTEIPESFWGLFRSINRDTYIEALLVINEEYQHSNYFLTYEVCRKILSDLYTRKRVELQREENETEFDMAETPSARVLGWLLKTGWLKKNEDYANFTTNITIPDYAAIFIEAFEKLTSDDMEDTEIYIYNVYATLYSFQNNPRVDLKMLRTALINTRKLNKALQDMLHNMDKFFGRLLEQNFYGDLLKEHLNGYVEEIVRKKYHILKTSDNFYIYKNDIKRFLRDMRDDEEWIENVRMKAAAMKDTKEDVLELLDQIERGFDDIEHRIANMDREHSKYVRATVTRLQYLLSRETDTKGLFISLLNQIAASDDRDEMIQKTGEKMNLSHLEILSEKSLYKRNRGKRDFGSRVEPEEPTADLDREDVLKLNKIQKRYSKKQIEEFIEENMEDEVMDSKKITMTDESFEKLILSYDYCTRKSSKYQVVNEEPEMIEKDGYIFPALQFVRKSI